MKVNMKTDPQIEKKYYNRKEVAKYTSLGNAWLERAAWGGYGPPYIKILGRVLYPLDELNKWLQAYPLKNIRHME